jgi:hypothetical protein
MTRALVAWEDKYCVALHSATGRILRARAVDPAAAVPVILRDTTRGNGTFERYVRTTWPNVRPAGLPADKGAIDHLVCVVDGDRLHDLLRGKVPRPPQTIDDIAGWHEQAERTWQAHLRSCCDPSGPAQATVHGVVLRWARESIALAAYDAPSARSVLAIVDDPRLSEILAKCTPDPRTVADARFTETFRKPLECLRLVRGGLVLDKASPEIDDAISALSKNGLATLRARVPDLTRIADLVWSLHGSAA